MSPKLSSPFNEMKNNYDAVVIGSGYGGGVAAARLSERGIQVCILERGLEIPTGQFPKTFNELRKNSQLHLEKKVLGATNKLFDYRIGKDISVLVGCGLGGTSLINANVGFDLDAELLDRPEWPTDFKADSQLFQSGLSKAKFMLQPNTFPNPNASYPPLIKISAMEKAAQAMDAPLKKLPLYVSFEDKKNNAGFEMKACNGCGDCISGCNVGAKNTVNKNYLPYAKERGAEIFCSTHVDYIEKVHGGYKIHGYHLMEDESKKSFVITCAACYLAAGTLGSTEILLRSKEKTGLSLSSKLGEHFTGNGDFVGFTYNNDVPLNSVGRGDKIEGNTMVGPSMTAYIDLKSNPNIPFKDKIIIADGSCPSPLGKGFFAMAMPMSNFLGWDSDKGLKDWLKEKWRVIQSFFGGVYVGAMYNSQTFLVMAHDDEKGKISLEENKVKIHWKNVGKQAIFERIVGLMKKGTAALGGIYFPAPSYSKLMNFNLMSVHPLGGCIMGNTVEDGVVNHACKVFDASQSNAFHEGLFVMDGSVVPLSLGVNPSLTITAIAERAMLINQNHSN